MGFLMHPNDTQYPPGPLWGPGRGTCLLAPPAHCAAPTCGLPVLLASYILPVWGKVLRLFTSCEALCATRPRLHAYAEEPLPKS